MLLEYLLQSLSKSLSKQIVLKSVLISIHGQEYIDLDKIMSNMA